MKHQKKYNYGEGYKDQPLNILDRLREDIVIAIDSIQLRKILNKIQQLLREKN